MNVTDKQVEAAFKQLTLQPYAVKKMIAAAMQAAPVTCERIICAAIRSDRKVYCGYRHANIYQICELLTIDDSVEEGFITTDKGRFVTREEAWAIADKAGQIINKGEGIDGLLFSENLY